MISPASFIDGLRKSGTDFFTGVPDSLLKGLCFHLEENVSSGHVTAASEGGAMGLAAGYYLATGNPAMVYMQNSGIGNAVNPLLSLLDPEVYSIPALLVIGLRGDPATSRKVGGTDEPQHKSQGKLTVPLLDTMHIPWEYLPSDETSLDEVLDRAYSHMKEHSSPYALIVKKGTFSVSKSTAPLDGSLPSREEAVGKILEYLPEDAAIVSTTGMTSRELYELREKRCEGHGKDFLTVGSMGHASQIALGISLSDPGRKVVCLDGDGAALMHMGGLAVIGERAGGNYLHVVFNNEAHDSVGGQPIGAVHADLCGIARSCGYDPVIETGSLEELASALKGVFSSERKTPAFLEVKTRKGARKNLGRPSASPVLNKERFMDFLKGKDHPSPQAYHIGEEARQDFLEEIIRIAPKSLFLVHGGKSYLSSGAEELVKTTISKASEVLGREISSVDFSDFHPNPDVSEIEAAYNLMCSSGCDAIVCLGGGSCMDTAKMARHLYLERKGERLPLLAVPTTSGTGAEATRFAVFYDNHKKISVDFPDVLPDSAFVIPSLTFSQGEYLTLCAGFDAFAQACESYWNVHATAESVEYSTKAIKDIYPVLLRISASKEKGEPFFMTEEERFRMSRGSYWAGRAINITRTTAPHAFAYFLTTHYGYPHGHAVAMTFPFFHALNVLCPEESFLGEDYGLFRERMFNLSDLLSMEDPHAMKDLVVSLGLGTLRHEDNFDYEGFLKAVNPARLSNNPARVDENVGEKLVDYLKSRMS